MSSDTFSSANPPSHDVLAKAITSTLPGVDAARAQGYADLAVLRDAKARSLAREQKLLAQKHGTVRHPRITTARARFAQNQIFRREIAVMREIVETPLPATDKNTFVIHGFVRRRLDHAGIPRLTVAITDAEGNWIRELGYACTDKRGYFLLQAKLSVNQLARDIYYVPAEVRSSSETGTSETSATTEEKETKLRLRVFNAKGDVLHTEIRPVVVQAGSIDYRYILIGDDAGECACTPPPAKVGEQPSSGGSKPPACKDATEDDRPTTPRVTGLKPYDQPTIEELQKPRQPVTPKPGDQETDPAKKDVSTPVTVRITKPVKKIPTVKSPTTKKKPPTDNPTA